MSARPMHILYVAPFGLRHKTTVWARVLPLARQLVARGAQCTILVPPWDSPEDGGLAQNVDGVAIIQVNVQGGLPAIVTRLMQEIALRKPDIVHCVKPRAYAGIVQWLLWQRRRMGKPTPRIYLDLDDWEQAWQRINRYPPPVARFLAWQEEWGIRHADAITVASRWLEARARIYAPHTPILYLPNGVDLPPSPASVNTPISAYSESTHHSDLPPNQKHAEIGVSAIVSGELGSTAYGSRLTDQKNVLFFTRFVEVEPAWFAAFASALFAVEPGAHLLIAGTPLHANGDAPSRAALPPHIAHKVTWLGHVAPPTLPALYAASTVAIFPAAESTLQQAKCSVRLATTLLAGVPVIASAVGEQANYGAHGAALLVPPDASPAAYASEVARLLNDTERRQAIVTAAYSHLSARYRWHDLADKLLTFYRDLSTS